MMNKANYTLLVLGLGFLIGCTNNNVSSTDSTTSSPTSEPGGFNATYSNNSLTFTATTDYNYRIRIVNFNTVLQNPTPDYEHFFSNNLSGIQEFNFNEDEDASALLEGKYRLLFQYKSSAASATDWFTALDLSNFYVFGKIQNVDLLFDTSTVEGVKILNIPPTKQSFDIDYSYEIFLNGERVLENRINGNKVTLNPQEGLNNIKIARKGIDDSANNKFSLSLHEIETSFLHNFGFFVNSLSGENRLEFNDLSEDLNYELVVNNTPHGKFSKPNEKVDIETLFGEKGSYDAFLRVSYKNPLAGQFITNGQESESVQLFKHKSLGLFALTINNGNIVFRPDIRLERYEYQRWVPSILGEGIGDWEDFSPSIDFSNNLEHKISLSDFNDGINRVRIIPIPKSSGSISYLSFKDDSYVFSFVKGLNLTYNNETFSWNPFPLNYSLSLVDTNSPNNPITLYEGKLSNLNLTELPTDVQNQIKPLTEKNYQVQLRYSLDFQDQFADLEGKSNIVNVYKLTPPSINGVSYDINSSALSWSIANQNEEQGFFVTVKTSSPPHQTIYDSPVIPYEMDGSTGKPKLIQSFSLDDLSDLVDLPPAQYDIELRPFSVRDFISIPPTKISILYGTKLYQEGNDLIWNKIHGFTYQLLNSSKPSNNILYEGTENEVSLLDISDRIDLSINNILVRYVESNPREDIPLIESSLQSNLLQFTKLNLVDGLTYNDELNRVEWNVVEGATGYGLTITNALGQVIVNETEWEGLSYVIPHGEVDLLTISVTPVSDNPNSFDVLPRTIDVLRGFELSLVNNELQWDSIEGVQLNYELRYGNDTVIPINEGTSYTLDVDNFAPGQNQVELIVKQNGIALAYGQPEIKSFTKLASVNPSNLTYSEGVFTWNAITHADRYEVYVNGEYQTDVNTNSYTLPNTYEGLIQMTFIAKNANGDYMESSEASVAIIDRFELSYDDGVLSWDPIGELSYQLYINDVFYEDLGRSTQFNLTSVPFSDFNTNLGPFDVKLRVYDSTQNVLLVSEYTFSETSVVNVLSQVDGLTYNDELNRVEWNVVEGATGYGLTITNALGQVIVNETEWEGLSYVIPHGEVDLLTISVTPVSDNPNSFDVLPRTIDVLRGFELSLVNNELQWDSIEGVQLNYELRYGNDTVIPINEGTSYTLDVDNFAPGQNQVELIVKQNGIALAYGQPEIKSFTKLASVNPSNLTYSEGVFTWNAITHADRYEVYVNGEYQTDVNTNSYTLPNTYEGLIQMTFIAKNANGDYMESSEASVAIIDRFELSYDDGVLSWDPIGELSYQLYINDVFYEDLGRSTQFNLTSVSSLGVQDHTISIRPYDSTLERLFKFSSSKVISLYKLAALNAGSSSFTILGRQVNLPNLSGEQFYEIAINGTTFLETTSTEQFVLPSVYRGVYDITIVIKDDSALFIPSNQTTVKAVIGLSLMFEENQVKWTNISSMQYQVFIKKGQNVIHQSPILSNNTLFYDLSSVLLSPDLYQVTIKVIPTTENQLDFDVIQLDSPLRVLHAMNNIQLSSSSVTWNFNSSATVGYEIKLYRTTDESLVFTSFNTTNNLSFSILGYPTDLYKINILPVAEEDYFMYADLNASDFWFIAGFELTYNYPTLSVPNINGLNFTLQLHEKNTNNTFTFIRNLSVTVDNRNMNIQDQTFFGLEENKEYQFRLIPTFVHLGQTIPVAYRTEKSNLNFYRLGAVSKPIFNQTQFTWEQNVNNLTGIYYKVKFNDNVISNQYVNVIGITNQSVMTALPWEMVRPYYFEEVENTGLSIESFKDKVSANEPFYIPSTHQATNNMQFETLSSPSINLYISPGYELSTLPELRLKVLGPINHGMQSVKVQFDYFSSADATTPSRPSEVRNLAQYNSVSNSLPLQNNDKKVIVSAILESTLPNVVSSNVAICTYLVDAQETRCGDQPIANARKINRIFAGARNTAIMSNQGSFWSFGFPDFIHLSNKEVKVNLSPAYYLLDDANEVTKLSIGHSHAAFITESGELFTWGFEGDGRLGNERVSEVTRFNPTKVANLSLRVIDVSTGFNHSLILTADNKIHYTGLLGETSVSQFKQIDTTQLPKILSIVSGYEFAGLITDTKEAYLWGDNSDKQLAQSNTATKLNEPNKINLANVKSLALGKAHGLALNENGEVYSWGKFEYGALGRLNLNADQENVTKVPNLPAISLIAAGDQTSYAVSLDGKQLWSWGWNSEGQLGRTLGFLATASATPTQINLSTRLESDEYIINVIAGYNNAAFLTNKGRIFIWGSRSNFKLGGNDAADRYSPGLLNIGNITNNIVV